MPFLWVESYELGRQAQLVRINVILRKPFQQDAYGMANGEMIKTSCREAFFYAGPT